MGDSRNDATLEAGQVAAAVATGSLVAGRYLVRRELGRGGMGAVYEVLDQELGETVALKILRAPDEVSNALARFKREVRVARRATHRNVARTYDFGEFGSLYFLTMEWVDGTSLADVLARQGKLALDRVADIGLQLCRGLYAAHEAGIVHRDLKPANVLLETSGRVVITDFGIARATEGDADITAEGASMVGTPTYMAPEQVRGGAVDGRTDLFSLGIMLLEMLTGVRAFERDSPMATAVARLEEDAPYPGSLADLPVAISDVIRACLARDPAERPPTAEAVALVLDPFVRSPEGTDTQPFGNAAGGETTQCANRRHKRATGFASARRPPQGVAVMPFRYRGPAADEYIAEIVTDEVVDALARTHGLKVPAASATSPFAELRDPKRIGAELGVDALVEGTLQRVADRIRLSARLVRTQTGLQVWSERFDGEMTDLFELQDRLAQRVTESLRVQLQSGVLRCSASSEAMELYLQARRQMKEDFKMGGEGPGGAVDLFERCLDVAPDFAPAVAGKALAASRMWFFYSGDRPGQRNWPVVCRQAVARALELASDLPETHIAAARMHVHETRYRAAAVALRKALELAPTCAAAHALLGSLQCEAGRPDEGIRHIELAAELDPGLRDTMITAARHHALHGRFEQAEQILDELDDGTPETARVSAIVRSRMLLWTRRFDELRGLVRRWNPDQRRHELMPLLLARVSLGEQPRELLTDAFERFTAGAAPRLECLARQIACEVYAAMDEPDNAFVQLRHASETGLVDVDWLHHCPALDALRDMAGYREVELAVQGRADELWALARA